MHVRLLLILLTSLYLLLVSCTSDGINGQSSNGDIELDASQFSIAERNVNGDVLVLSIVSSVTLSSLDQSIMISEAEKQVNDNLGYRLVRIFFKDDSDTVREDAAKCLIEWTQEEGLNLVYDRSRPRESEYIEPELELPDYTILDEVNLLVGGYYGDVLVPSLTPDTQVEELEAVAGQIAQAEGFDEISLYCTEEAYRANFSASFLEDHPDALKDGFLGHYKDGVFRPSSYN